MLSRVARWLTMFSGALLIAASGISVWRIHQVSLATIVVLGLGLIVIYLELARSRYGRELAAVIYGLPGICIPIMLLRPTGDEIIGWEVIHVYVAYFLSLLAICAALICRRG